jgi:disulfide oxidoreductase YuzD
MRPMKKLRLLLSLLLSMSLFLSCTPEKSLPETEVYFFYMEHCPSCDEYIMAEELSSTINTLVKKNKSFSGEAINIILDKHAQKMKEILTGKDLANISHVLPLLVVNDEYFVGYEEISEKISSLKNQQ